MSVDDAAWLVDMVIACNKIERFVRGVDGAHSSWLLLNNSITQ
jgi:hypothetical protein